MPPAGMSLLYRLLSDIDNKGGNGKTKTSPGILRPEKMRNNCTRQWQRIVLVKCTRFTVYRYF